jgi:uncharacterized RDD family membrane protein YckC
MKNMNYAGFWKRFAAWFIDFCIISAVFFGLSYIVPPQLPIMNLIRIAIFWVYFAFMESSTKQATLGKMALHIVVVDYQGKKISFGRATGRYFAKYLSGLILLFGFFMAGWTKKKQALHDIIASTYVINAK